MEAKDTVIDYEQTEVIVNEVLVEPTNADRVSLLRTEFEGQAEISFRAGTRKAQDGIWDKVMGAKKSGFDEGRSEGIREVVEFVRSWCGDELPHWQAKLKEWGIK